VEVSGLHTPASLPSGKDPVVYQLDRMAGVPKSWSECSIC